MGNDDDTAYSVLVLGPVAVIGPDGPADPGAPKSRLLLALLATEAGHTVTTERLIDGLWGDAPPATARKAVQVHVSNLRRSVGADFPLETIRAGYRLDSDRVLIDAREFERDVEAAESALEQDPAEAAATLTSALARWRGPPYADLADEPAIRPDATRLTELRVRAVEQRIDADLRLGRHERVLGELESLTADHPYRERLRALQLLALYRSGRQAEALRAYERTRVTLVDELGIDPGPELRRLHQQLLDQSPDLDLVVPAGAGSVTDADRAGSRELVPGVAVRGYELRERLGDRAGTTVYRAFHRSVGREVALKVISPERANRPRFVKQFDADCRRLAALEHPNIVVMLDSWRDPSGAYISLPLMRGGSLADLVEQGPVSMAAGLQIIDQVCAALDYAHRQNVVHGDVRPSNVMLDEDGNAYLSDFRCAGDQIPSPPAENPDGASHVAPEQLAGGPIDVTTDVFGAGVLACRLLAGVPPGEIAFADTGLPPAFGTIVGRATDPDPTRRYERIVAFHRELRRCFGVDTVTTAPRAAGPDTRNPYKGLRSFRESDAPDFFGRDDLVTDLIDRVRGHRLTAVVGPSGSGKSSLVHAGLIPAVRSGSLGHDRDLVIAGMFPGAYPFEELATALLEVGVRSGDVVAELHADERGLLRAAEQSLPDDRTDLLLVIDQFEELFALTSDPSTRRRFLDLLATTARDADRIRVVITLRADFFGSPLDHAEFGALMKSSLLPVALPRDDDLAAAIAEPARRVGLEIEPGLVPTILRDVADEPGSLPMLQYALTELADRCDGTVLTIDAYRRTGGVIGAIAARAEEIYSGLSSSGREAARAMLVRLVSVGDDTDTRRRVRRSELDALGLNPLALQTAVDAFGAFRLLTFDHDPVTRGPTVEVAHEALIREWPRYRVWVDEQRDDLRTERRLASTVDEWRGSDRRPELLIAGVRLERFERWAESTSVPLTEDEESFIALSRDREDEHRRRSARRHRRGIGLVSLLAVIALIGAAVAFVQRNRANDHARAAEEQSRSAAAAAEDANRLRAAAEREAVVDRSRALATELATLSDPDARVLLALEAVAPLDDVGRTDQLADSALYQSVYDHRLDALTVPADLSTDSDQSFSSEYQDKWYVTASDDHRMVAVTPPGRSDVVVIDASNGAEVGRLENMDAHSIGHTVWDASGRLSAGDVDGRIWTWDTSGEIISTEKVGNSEVWPMWIDQRATVYREVRTYRWDGRYDIVVLDRATGDELRIAGPIRYWSLDDANGRLLVNPELGDVHLVDLRTSEIVTPPSWLDPSHPLAMADDAFVDQSGQDIWVWIGSALHRIDPAGNTIHVIETDLLDTRFAEQTSDGELIIVGSAGKRPGITVFDTATGHLVAELALSEETSEAFAPVFDGTIDQLPDRRIVLGGDPPLIWDFDRPGGARHVGGISDLPMTSSFDTADRLVVGDLTGRIDSFDANGDVTSLARPTGAVGQAVMSADGSTLIVPGENSVEVIDLATGEQRTRGPEWLVRPLGVTPDGSTMILGTALEPANRQHFVAIVDARTGELIARVATLVTGWSSAISSDGSLAAVPVWNLDPARLETTYSNLLLVDMSTGAIIRRGPTQHSDCLLDAEFSTGDEWIAAIGCDGELSLYDADLLGGSQASASVVHSSTLPAPGVGVTFGPGDEIIATSDDGTVAAYAADGLRLLWDIDVGEHVGVPNVRDDEVWLTTSTGPVDAPSSRGAVVALPLDHDALVTLARETATRELHDGECERHLGRRTCSAD